MESRKGDFSRRDAIRVSGAAGIGVLGAAVIGRSRSVNAQDATPTIGPGASTSPSEVLTLAGAQAIVDGAFAKATELGIALTIVVIDASSNIKALSRMDGSGLATLTLAESKAFTALAFGTPTDMFASNVTGDAAVMASLLQNPKVVLLGGGLPIQTASGTLVGAVGCSGGTADQDKEAATAGLAAIGL